MRTLAIILLSMISITVNAQNMKDINETVSQLFVASDNREWKMVEEIFADQVELDYSSMNGNPAVVLSPKQITDSWKTILPGFTSTHHQLGNFISHVSANTAEVFCYGTATHYLEHQAGNIWTVVGSYNLELQQKDGKWRVSKMKFNFKYQDGNTQLPQAAMDKVKESNQ
ncbi:nuclear transport factor 2 family protein [Marinifilum caeruleilacunae]|uniref:Nuclear transport factor 2 family protein n=1 Tax=Marinifilum caeruleilacunae TaxID=2499076 RepID=A0ABX1WQH2_9BACT|nr:nuclear transport factor 2 family protein [Marinifilum caeruleilacunae]NOU58308.1 nuclear transport factor 2 family protein [Marinifilum caeruleilacunae]